MSKKVFCGIIVFLCVLSSIIPMNTAAADTGTGTLQITAAPAGADIYIDGEFTRSVTPCTLELPAGMHKVELKIPGYETYTNQSVQITARQTTALTDIMQLPDLTETDEAHTITVTTLTDKVRWVDTSGMNAITVAQLKLDTGTPISLREAIQAVKNEPAENGHYRIEFDAGLKGGTISLFLPGDGKFPVDEGLLQNLYIEKRGNMTINGDIDRDGEADITLEPYTNGVPSSPKGIIMNVYTSDVTLAGLVFDGGDGVNSFSDSFSTLTLRVPDKSALRYDIENVHVLGCMFDHSMEVGVATCGAYGYAGTSYGGAGTTNFTDLVFSGNTFTKASLFSFAGAGDEDYNVIDGYYISANKFYNGCVGMLAADAHTWYVFGKDDPSGNGGVAGQAGFCEHNQLKNIYLTGNYFDHTENAGTVGATTANLGNSNNLIENMYVRNNTSVLADGLESGVTFENASIGRDDRYAPEILHHNTANNVMRNVYIEDNNFEIGDKGRFGIDNIQGGCVRDSYMDGTGNLIENIQIKDNRIECDLGAFITNIGGFCGTINNDVSGNTMRDIVFSGNELTGVDADCMTSGLEITNHSNIMNSHIPAYHDNAMSDITVENNTVSGYCKGISVGGSLGNGVNAHNIEDVTVSGNTVTCKADGEFGIIAAGNLMDAYGGDAFNGSTNCEAKDITISGNNITAPGGILLAGTYVNAPVKGSLEGNRISSVSVFENIITRSEGLNDNRPVPGITAADIIAPWPRIEANTVLNNNSCGQPDIHDNTITGYNCDVFNMSNMISSCPIGSQKTAEEILSEFKTATEAAFGENSMDWDWYGDSFSSSAIGSFTAVARRNGQIGFDYLYQCVNTTDEYCVSFEIGSGTRTGGGELVQSVKSGEDAEEPIVTPPDGYSFIGWDKAFTDVSAPLTVHAVYSRLGTVQVTGVTLNKHAESMTVGDILALSAIVLPEDATNPSVAWLSSDTEVATVDQTGKITAVSPGNTTITASADGISDTCEVTVESAAYRITTAANNAAYGTVTGGGSYSSGASVTLTATPSTGCRFVRWTDGTGLLSTNASYTLIANADRNITAEFAPIGIPTLYASSAGYTSTKLAWTAVEGAAGYELWRCAYAGGAYTKLGTTAGTSYTDYGLATNTTYYYKVNAYCTVSTATTYGSQSAYTAATPVPSAPELYASATSYSSTNISWSAVDGANGYELSRATSPSGIYKPIKTTSSLSYNNTSLGTGTTYYYKVRAYRTVGRTKLYGNYSIITAATPVLSSVASATASAYYPTSVKVSWSSVPGRTSYEVWRSTSPNNGFTLIKTTSSTSFKDTTLTPFVTYYYQIKVYRTVSRQKIYGGSVSPTASATPILGNVTGVRAAMSSASSNKLSWASVTGASGYEIWRSTTAGSGYVLVKSTSGRSYTDSNLIPNTTYYYQVRAYRKVGSSPVPSALSAPVSATPYFGSVTNPRAVRSSTTKIKLTWSAVSGRTGYEIYRSTLPDSGFVMIKSTTSTSFTDSALMTGVTYYYKICAYRTVNTVKYRSTDSVVVSATP